MKIIIRFIIAFGIFTTCSCALFNKTKLTSTKTTEKEEIQILGEHLMLSQQSQLVLIDSNHNNFTMMLYPKGKFTFSIKDGFEGEAEKILISGKQESQKILNLRQENKRDSIIFKANFSSHKETNKTLEKNKLDIGYNWTLLTLLMIIIALIWVYRRFWT